MFPKIHVLHLPMRYSRENRSRCIQIEFRSGHHLHDPNLLFVDTMINIAKGFDLDSAAEWAEKKILLLKEYIDCLQAWH